MLCHCKFIIYRCISVANRELKYREPAEGTKARIQVTNNESRGEDMERGGKSRQICGWRNVCPFLP
jgi:hypothetical protein